METSRTINVDLLMAIRDSGEITRNELEQVYLPPKRPGVVLRDRVCLDGDLNDLIAEGYISYDGEKYKFLHDVLE